MTLFPYSRLFLGQSRTILTSGPHIQSVHTLTGEINQSTASLPLQEKEAVLKSGPIRCTALDTSKKYLATSGDDKILKLWDVDTLKLLSERELPKKPTEIRFTRDSKTILVSDKFGDVFSYPLHSLPPPSSTEKSKYSSHENPSGGALVLGHASLVTAFLLSPDERYIITADRDEHIRVSWYPQGYNIEMYCLGHTKFVSAIHIPPFDPSTLISGGGDAVIKLWDWMSGKVKSEIKVWEKVKPFVKVRGKKYRRGEGDAEGDEDGRRENNKKKRFKRKGKGGGRHEAEDEAERDNSEPGELDSGDVKEIDAMGDILLVVHKIDTLDSRTKSDRHVVFSAVGATALFVCPYPAIDNPVLESRILHFDFEKPVVDFFSDDENRIWVSLDGGLAIGEEVENIPKMNMVRVIRLVEGELREVDDASIIPLRESLNSQCLLRATPDDRKLLDMYSPLSTMPKNNEVEHNAMARSLSEEDDTASTGGRADALKTKQLSKKELGRLKSKRALLTKDSKVGEAAEEEEMNKRSRLDEERQKDEMDES